MTNKKTISTLVGLMSAGAIATSIAGEPVAPVAMEEPSPLLTGSIGMGYDSMYNFRGVDLGPDAIWSGIDFNMALSDAVGLNFGAWYTNPTGSVNGSHATDELDLYAFITGNIGDLEVAVGGTGFFFLEDGSDAQELGFTLGYSLGAFDIGGVYYYDFTTDGHYLELNGGTSIELTERVSLELGTGISYGEGYYGVSGFNHVFLTASLPIAITERLTLSPYISHTWAVDSLDDLGEGDHLYGGAAFSVDF